MWAPKQNVTFTIKTQGHTFLKSQRKKSTNKGEERLYFKRKATENQLSFKFNSINYRLLSKSDFFTSTAWMLRGMPFTSYGLGSSHLTALCLCSSIFRMEIIGEKIKLSPKLTQLQIISCFFILNPVKVPERKV